MAEYTPRTAMRWLSRGLRPGLALALFLTQFTTNRATLFTANPYLVALGVILVLAGLWLWLSASHALRQALQRDAIAQTGPYRAIRHPIYVSIYLLSAGLGLIFFACAWFIVLLAFLPLWHLESREEERRMMAEHGQAYAAYRARTGAYWPKMRG